MTAKEKSQTEIPSKNNLKQKQQAKTMTASEQYPTETPSKNNYGKAGTECKKDSIKIQSLTKRTRKQYENSTKNKRLHLNSTTTEKPQDKRSTKNGQNSQNKILKTVTHQTAAAAAAMPR